MHIPICMATCHSLTLLNNQLIGDPLDKSMFDWTQWTLEEPPNVKDENKFDLLPPTVVKPPLKNVSLDGNCMEIGILRQFQFSSNLGRMGVITRQLGASEFEFYVKVKVKFNQIFLYD